MSTDIEVEQNNSHFLRYGKKRERVVTGHCHKPSAISSGRLKTK